MGSYRKFIHRSSALALLSVILCCPAAARAEPPADSDSRYAGRPLAEALLDLRQLGLKIVFASSTVRPELTVETEPLAVEPRLILDQLLAPHGLTARDGPNGTIVVVPGSERSTRGWITGVVRDRLGGSAIAGVDILLLNDAARASSADDGTFRLQVPAPGTYALDVRRRGFVVEHFSGIEVHPGLPTELSIALDAAPVTEERVIVTPSRVSLMRQDPSLPLALSRDEMLALPHLGGDFFRALSLLPGITANDVSAEFHVRGGRSDETQILLDGQELYESYHLQDFDNALSVVAATTLERVDLSTGGFPVEHGDRMSGVLDMTTLTPTGPRRLQAGLSLLNIQLGASGQLDDGRAAWIAQARRGTIDLASRLLGNENPQYWDVFGKLDYQLSPKNSLRVNVLHSSDELEIDEISPDGSKFQSTNYKSSYLWLTHQAIVGSDLFFETAVSRTRIDRDRGGLDLEDDAQFDIRDQRQLTVLGLRQDWNLKTSEKHYLKWGAGFRDFTAIYDYAATYNFFSPLALIRENPEAVATTFLGEFESDHTNFYAADLIQLGKPAVLELGLRYDEHSLTAENLLSPRVNLAFSFGSRSVLRAAWGRFTQSQRPYELQVEDGETAFNRVEKSDHRLLGFEYLFAGTESRSLLALRVELYRREVTNPLARWENLYEPINTFPEVEPDRVRIAPDRSFAEGIEVFLRGGAGRVGWWATYSYATTEDELDGRRAPRQFDQTHTLNIDLDYRINPRWTLNTAWRYHTGWPTTPLTLELVPLELDEDETGETENGTEFVPLLGDRFSGRLSIYHRLDLRLSRRWRSGRREFAFFVDVQNAYNRRNVAGFDFEIDQDAGLLIPNEEYWAPILPSLGISVDF